MCRILLRLLMFGSLAFADETSIGGTVVDRNGFGIPNTTVAIKDASRNISVLTDSSGRFFLTGLQPRSYRLTFDAPGFKIVAREAFPTTTSSAILLPAVVLDVDPSRAICELDITGLVPSATKKKK